MVEDQLLLFLQNLLNYLLMVFTQLISIVNVFLLKLGISRNSISELLPLIHLGEGKVLVLSNKLLRTSGCLSRLIIAQLLNLRPLGFQASSSSRSLAHISDFRIIVINKFVFSISDLSLLHWLFYHRSEHDFLLRGFPPILILVDLIAGLLDAYEIVIFCGLRNPLSLISQICDGLALLIPEILIIFNSLLIFLVFLV